MDGNEDMAKELEGRITKLSKIVKYFETRWEDQPGEEITDQINELKGYAVFYMWQTWCSRANRSSREIARLQTQIQEWETLGRLTKAFSAPEHRETLNGYNKAVDNAFEEMQVSDVLNTVTAD